MRQGLFQGQRRAAVRAGHPVQLRAKPPDPGETGIVRGLGEADICVVGGPRERIERSFGSGLEQYEMLVKARKLGEGQIVGGARGLLRLPEQPLGLVEPATARSAAARSRSSPGYS